MCTGIHARSQEQEQGPAAEAAIADHCSIMGVLAKGLHIKSSQAGIRHCKPIMFSSTS